MAFTTITGLRGSNHEFPMHPPVFWIRLQEAISLMDVTHIDTVWKPLFMKVMSALLPTIEYPFIEFSEGNYLIVQMID